MAHEHAEFEPGGADICYHCKVFYRAKICFKDDPVLSETVDAQGGSLLWKDFIEQASKHNRRAMALARTITTKVTEMVNFWGSDPPTDKDLDSMDNEEIPFHLLDVPETIGLCARCCCLFSKVIRCHCLDCLGSDLPGHYVIIMHGILSAPLDMGSMAKVLLVKYPTLFVYLPRSIAGRSLIGLSKTVRLLGNELNALFAKIPRHVRISLVGHSFGGVLLRYWHLFYVKGALSLFCKARQQASNDENSESYNTEDFHSDNNECENKEIVWCNYIAIATPHAGIFENAYVFRQIIKTVGFKSVSELDNETVDLLYLIGNDGRRSQACFSNICNYGNISGDTLVAPRTSIILPRFIVDDTALHFISKSAECEPGVPVEVKSCLSLYETTLKSGTSHEQHVPDDNYNEALIDDMVKLFYTYVAETIRQTPHLQNLFRGLTHSSEHPPAQTECMKVFSSEELEYFETLIRGIVSKSNKKLLEEFKSDPQTLLTEVLMYSQWILGTRQFAVYIPKICTPHRAIMSYAGVPGAQMYTKHVLSHFAEHFNHSL